MSSGAEGMPYWANCAAASALASATASSFDTAIFSVWINPSSDFAGVMFAKSFF